ncbi:MAG: LPS-assembly protein LptD [Chlamydiae bacterium]|nr:LPS-assembly protein LptD [Chlamydiota bacterium]
MRITLITLLSFFSVFAFSEHQSNQVRVNLNSPTYYDGILNTDHGGVLEGDKIRIQAQHIEYIKKETNGQSSGYVRAHGNLLVRYHERAFVGDSLEYNFETRQGVIINGRTQIGCWFVGGEEIQLKSDNSYRLYKTSLTTCESGSNLWEIKLKKATVHEYDIITAKNAQIKIFKVPVFWFPYLKTRLSTLQNIPAYYSFVTGGSQGQIVSLRYLAYSSLALKSYLQLDFWFKKGPSGSFQLDYKAPNHPTTFQSNSFVAYDKQARNPPTGALGTSMLRQRYVGELNSTIANKLHINGQYEKLSDDFVLETYFNRYYFLQTQRHTSLEFRMHDDIWLSYLRAEVRINRFQTVNQELPVFHFHLKPIQLGKSGFITDVAMNIGYLDYVFGSFVDNTFPNYRSSRLEIKPSIYYPIRLGGLNITPKGEYIGVGYGQTPSRGTVWNTLGIVSADANYKLSRVYKNKLRHTIEPYTTYQFMTQPTVPFNDHFFFNMDDAYVKINQLRWGIRNSIYTKTNDQIKKPLTVDVYSYGFFNNTTIGTSIPKVYLEITQGLPYLFTSFSSAYNLQHNRIDFANIRTAFTISEDFALSFTFMHRSAFDYKKANHSSFLLDVFRSQADILASPLSDKRNVAQSKVYWRVTRDLILEFESRVGWLRTTAPPYNEMLFDVTILLPCNWRLVLSPQRTISPNSGAKYIWRLHASLQLGGKPPRDYLKPYIFW